MAKLTKEEKDLVKSFERGELKSAPHPKEEIRRYRKYAEVQLRKGKRVKMLTVSPVGKALAHSRFKQAHERVLKRHQSTFKKLANSLFQ